MIKLKRWMLWPALVVVILLLSAMRGLVPDVATHQANGVDVASNPKSSHGEVTVRGVVVRVKRKNTGSTTVKLQADDGAPITVNIPPQVGVKAPRVGQRVEVSGSHTDAGLLTLNSSSRFRDLEPRHGSDRAKYVDHPQHAGTFERFWTEARWEVVRTTRQGTKYIELSRSGSYLGTALVAPEMADQVHNGMVGAFTGYRTDEDLIIVEEIGR